MVSSILYLHTGLFHKSLICFSGDAVQPLMPCVTAEIDGPEQMLSHADLKPLSQGFRKDVASFHMLTLRKLQG